MLAGQNWVPAFIVMCAYAGIIIFTGIIAGGKLDMKKNENWGTAGKSLGTATMYFTLGAGAVSAYTFMGSPGWSFTKGAPVMYVIVYLCFRVYNSYVFNPRVWKLSNDHGIHTMPDAYGARYSSPFARGFAALTTSIGLICSGVLQITGCGYIVNAMSGGAIPTQAAQVVAVVLVLIYIYRSGLRGVGWTSITQGILMLTIGWVVLFIVSFKMTGSVWPTAIFQQISTEFPQYMTLPGNVNDFSDQYWTTAILVSTFSYWPNNWISAAGAKDAGALRKSANLLTSFYFLSMFPMIIVGFICITALEPGSVPMDQAGLILAMHYVPWPVAGLLAAGTFAAAQSSVSPLIHAAAMMWTQDIIGPLAKWSTEKRGVVQRYMTVVPAVIMLAFAFTNPTSLPDLLLVGYGFLSQAYPLLIGTFFWPRSTKQGAIGGMVAGVVMLLIFTFGPGMRNYMGIHAGVWGWMINIPVHIIVSMMTKPEKRENLERFFPEKLLKKAYGEE